MPGGMAVKYRWSLNGGNISVVFVVVVNADMRVRLLPASTTIRRNRGRALLTASQKAMDMTPY